MTKDSELPLAKYIAQHVFGSGVFVDRPLTADASACDLLTDYDTSAAMHLAASLRARTPLVLEGSVMSVLADLPLAKNVPPILWALDEPETVSAVHRLYGATGIDVALAPLVGCLPEEIERLGPNVSMKTLVDAQIRAASSCGCPYVMAEIGNPDKSLDTKLPQRSVSSRDAFMSSQDLSSYRALVLTALRFNVHGFILGRMSSLHDLDAIYQVIRSVSDVPVIGFCLLEEGTLETPAGDSIEDIMMAYGQRAETDALAIGFDEVPARDLCQIAGRIAEYAQVYNVCPAARIRSSLCAGVHASETVDAAVTSVAQAAHECARSGIAVVGAASGVLPAMVADLVAAFHT